MLLIGLTGGIGSGKSTVSALLARRGAVIIDADAITRELQQPGTPVLAAMVERFGSGILAADGTLDRQAVADIVFADAAALADLNKIVHPAVGAEIADRLRAEAGTDHLVVLDVPLLVESGRDDLAGLVVVDVDPEVAVRRLVAQRGMREDDVRARMARQASRGGPGGQGRRGARQLRHPGRPRGGGGSCVAAPRRTRCRGGRPGVVRPDDRPRGRSGQADAVALFSVMWALAAVWHLLGNPQGAPAWAQALLAGGVGLVLLRPGSPVPLAALAVGRPRRRSGRRPPSSATTGC